MVKKTPYSPVFSKDAILGSVPSISSEVLGLRYIHMLTHNIGQSRDNVMTQMLCATCITLDLTNVRALTQFRDPLLHLVMLYLD
jgi:hypothetical protein